MEIRKSQAVLSTISRVFLVVVMVMAALTGRPAYAAIAHRAALGGNNAGGATTLVLTKPSSPSAIVAGDVMIAVVTVRGGTGTTITPPSGWTLINSNDSTTAIKSSTYYKVATASEGTSYSWSLGATALKASGVISAYSGVDTVNPIMVQGSYVNTAKTTIDAPAVTTTVDGAMVIGAFSSATGTTFSASAESGMTLRGQAASTGAGASSRTTSGLQDIIMTTAGTKNYIRVTPAATAVGIGHSIALNPKPNFEQSGYRWFENTDSTGNYTYAKYWDNGGKVDQAKAVAVDASGNVYIAGKTGYDTVTGDLVLVKYNAFGVEQWSKTWATDVNDYANALALDTSGNIYVAGSTSTGFMTNDADQTLFKYNSSGVEQWSKTWGGTGAEIATDLALDTSGNIYVAGYTNSTGLTAGNNDQTLVKYNSSGVEQWSKTWGGTGYDSANALALDSSGSIYVAGSTSTGLMSGDADQTLVKYNASGVEQWSKTWGGDVDDYATDLALDTSGNIYVAGYTNSTGLNAGGYDQTLVKYNASGVEQWSKTWGGTSVDFAYALALDTFGNIYVAGYTNSTGLTTGGYDQTLVKYNSSGVEQWSKTWGGDADDCAYALALDTFGNIYVAGYTNSFSVSTADHHQTLLKFDSTGTIANCSACVDRAVTEVDRAVTEVDRAVTEVDRTTTEVDRAVTEVDITDDTTVTVLSESPVDVGSPLNSVAQNTVTTALAEQQIFRLRLLLHIAGLSGAPYTFKLQYATMSGTCDISFTGEIYADVTTSTPIAYANNTVAFDGQAPTANANDPTHSGHSKIMQEYNELNNTGVANAIAPGQDGLWDFALKDNGAPANTSYCFRIVKSDDSLLDTYSVIPQITTQAATFEQSGYRWFENADVATTFAKSWGGTGYDGSYALALDASGNIYVAGSTNSTGLTAGNADQTLVKYNSSGVEQWSKTWGGTGNDNAYALALDASGNIYVAGSTDSTGLTAGSYDQTLVKYDSSGVEQWSKTWGGTGNDNAYALALDTSGNIYVAGSTASTGLTAGNSDQTLVKYNSSGVEQWSKTWGGDGYDYAYAIALDTSGNIYVAGSTASTGLTAGSDDQTLVKYNSSGVEQWSKTWGGTGNDSAYALALDASGNIYVAGYTTSTGLTAGGTDQTLVKYNSSGVEQWSKTWGGTGADVARAIALDTSGNIYVAGSTASTGLTAGSSDQTLLAIDTSGSIAGCSSCVDRTTTEVDRAVSETDIATAEVDRTVTEVDRTVTEVDRTGVATITVVCAVSASIDVSTPLTTQNSAANAPASPTLFRLRSLIHVANKSASSGGSTFKLQYAAMSGTCDTSFTGESYADVTTSTAIAYADNTIATDGMGLTANANDPTHSSDTKVLQEYNELNNTGIATTIPAGQDGLWDFALKDNGGTQGTSYCFRMVKSDGNTLDSYSVIPQINIPSVGPTLEQQLRGGQGVVNGTKSPLSF